MYSAVNALKNTSLETLNVYYIKESNKAVLGEGTNFQLHSEILRPLSHLTEQADRKTGRAMETLHTGPGQFPRGAAPMLA